MGAAPPLVSVLGPIRLLGADGVLREPPGALPKRLLVALAVAGSAGRSVEGLTDDVWADDPPRNPRAALQMLVSRIRVLAADGAVRSTATGYGAGGSDLDAARAQVHRAEAGDAAAAAAAVELLAAEAAADADDSPVVGRLRAEVGALRDRARRARLAAARADGDPARALEDLEVLAAEHPYDGTIVADRMRALAACGRGAEAAAVFAAHRERLADELGADPSAELVALNAELLRASGVPTGAAAGRRPTELIGVRNPTTRLLGRDADLERLEALVADGRLTTILGAGGLGKTRLATELALRLAQPERAGAVTRIAFVELAGVGDGADVPAALLAAVGSDAVRRRIGDATTRVGQDLRERLRESLAERPTLLVLDNCEHLVDAVAAEVTELLAGVASASVVTTSRVPLALAGERVYPLAPLDAATDAAALFRERAEAARPGVPLAPATLERVCARLDGLPLAIELAAARIRTMSLDDLERRLDDRFGTLVGTDRSAPERHRTLLAVIDWSWRLLAPDEQRALRRLAAFPDGFPAEAAGVALGADAVPLLDELVLHSLLAVSEPPSGRTRYRMLETVRDFGLREAAAAGETTAALAGVDAWVLAFCRAEQADGGLTRTGLRVAEEEAETLVAALRRPVDGRESVVLEAYGLMGPVWSVRDRHGEVIELAPAFFEAWRRRSPHDGPTLEAAIAGATILTITAAFASLPSGRRAVAVLRSALGRLPSEDDRYWAVFGRLALAAADGGSRVGRALDEAVGSRHPIVATTARTIRGAIRENSGDVPGALEDAHEALRLAAMHGFDWHTSIVEASLAQLASQRGEHAEAVAHASASRAHDDPWDPEDRQLDLVLAAAEIAAGDFDAAEARYRALRRSASEPEDPRFEDPGADLAQIAAAGLAEVATMRGDVAAADALWSEAIATRRRSGRSFPWQTLTLASALAATARLHPDPDAALVEDCRALGSRLRARMLAARRLTAPFFDVPVFGVGVLGLAAWLAWPGRPGVTAAERSVAARLAGLADAMSARKDLASIAGVPPLVRSADPSAYDEARATPPQEAVARAVELVAGLQAFRM